MSTRTANATKGGKKKTTQPRTAQGKAKTATKVKPIDQLATPDKTQKSVRVHADLDRLPNGNGGVRYAERAAKDGSVVLGKVYIDQASYALLGQPKAITLDIKAA